MRLREERLRAGFTQAELAARAGVSRQLVGSVETGRHVPRVDAALALAEALGLDVGELFAAEAETKDIISGLVPAEGEAVRYSRVGDQVVTAPARVGPDGWDVADGLIEDGSVAVAMRPALGFAVAGCEPGLEVLERILREQGVGAVAATASSQAAIAALQAGRLHAAVVHAPDPTSVYKRDDATVARYQLARWRAGLAAAADTGPTWWQDALHGRVAVVQREAGAGVQRAFENATVADLPIPGPRVHSHIAAARRAAISGLPAVTIEPAALAAGIRFHALEDHAVELWVVGERLADAGVAAAMEVLVGTRFRQRLASIGGYDLTDIGKRVT
ncbi:MAG: helix-turn-helix domain-containing protein [Acidimicrobiia bacterium]|nr:helix-turn-helix domain-containing protein [Acidimicrobiia bacterium]